MYVQSIYIGIFVFSENEDENPVQSLPQDNREVNRDIKRYFKNFIKDLKKPNEKDIQPYMEIMAENFPDCNYDWRQVRDKVYSFVKHIKRETKKKEKDPKSVAKKKRVTKKKD